MSKFKPGTLVYSNKGNKRGFVVQLVDARDRKVLNLSENSPVRLVHWEADKYRSVVRTCDLLTWEDVNR